MPDTPPRPSAYAFDNATWTAYSAGLSPGIRYVVAWQPAPHAIEELSSLPHLEGLWVGDASPKHLAPIAAMTGLRVLRLNGVTSDDLRGLAALKRLRVLEISNSTVPSLAGLEHFPALECLVLDHVPRLTSLDPIGCLADLTDLAITTPASWDVSGKNLEVETLAPLGRLSNLEYLLLVRVKPARDGLRPLERLKKLRKLDIINVPGLTLADHARLAAALPQAEGDCLHPTFRMNFPAPCRRCGAPLEWLTAAPPRARRSLCPNCNRARLEAHLAEFERLRRG
jgi:hypothetical protein